MCHCETLKGLSHLVCVCVCKCVCVSVCVSVCSCMHTVLVCLTFGFSVVSERVENLFIQLLIFICKGNSMLHFNICLNLFFAPEVIASTCNLLKTQAATLDTQHKYGFVCVYKYMSAAATL